MIAILDFVFDEDKQEDNKYRYNVKLSDIDTNKVFYDKLYFIYLSMPKFNKAIEELDTQFDKWLYVLKNLNKLERIPERLQESIFLNLFEKAEIAKFSKEEYQNYEESLKYYRYYHNSLQTSKEERRIEGKIEGERLKQFEIAKIMLSDNEPIEKIMKYTGLTSEVIEKLK